MLAKDNPIILYVEDDLDDLLLLRQAAGKLVLQYNIIHVRTGDLALAWLVNAAMSCSAPALIVIDFNLPRFNGLETVRRIKKISNFCKTPIVIYTASEPDWLSALLLEEGIPIIRKGSSVRDIRGDVRSLVRLMQT